MDGILQVQSDSNSGSGFAISRGEEKRGSDIMAYGIDWANFHKYVPS